MFSISRGAALRLLVLLSVMCGAMSAGAADPEDNQPQYGVAKPLGDKFAANRRLDNQQSLLFVYRAASQKAAGVVTLFLDDKYHVSLQPGGFTVVCYDSERVDIRARLTLADADVPSQKMGSYNVGLKKGVAQFVRVSSQADGRIKLESIPTRIANDELKEARQQMHTLSRVPAARLCKADEPAIAAASATSSATAGVKAITFGTEVPFQNKKTDIKDMTPQGKKSLSQVVDKINKKYASASKVQVRIAGYADDGSSEKLNKRMSLERAKTVRTYLLQNGVRKQEILLVARGSKELARTHIAPLSKKRVDIEVSVFLS